MATSREALKGYFETNKRPNEAEFEKLIDSAVHLDEDKASDIEAQGGSNTSKFITPHTARLVVETFAPVKTVNGIAPNPSGDVSIANVSGTASTITGSISQNQVTNLVADLNGKQSTLISGANIKTVNGLSIIGPGNVGFVQSLAIPTSSFTLVDTVNAQNAFPPGCDEFTLSSNKTYFLKGRMILTFTGTNSRITLMGWQTNDGLNVQSIQYVTNTFFASSGSAITGTQNTAFMNSIAIDKVIVSGNTSSLLVIDFEGVLRCSTAGKLIPRIGFNVAPGGVTTLNTGSYIQLTEIGDNNVQAIGAVS